jgi:hypothetical protein
MPRPGDREGTPGVRARTNDCPTGPAADLPPPPGMAPPPPAGPTTITPEPLPKLDDPSARPGAGPTGCPPVRAPG